MADWKTVVYTEKGLRLLSKLIAGSSLTVMRIVSGAGLVPESELQNQTAVADPKRQLSFHPAEAGGSAQAEISALLQNTGLKAGYTARQIGVFAEDPDEGEILLFIAQDAAGEQVPAETEAPLFSAAFTFLIQFGDTSQIVMRAAPEDELTAELAADLFALLSHVGQQVASDEGAHGLRYNKAEGILEKFDRRTDTWVPIEIGSPRLQELTITTPPLQTDYLTGMVFQPEGLVVTAHYSQAVSATVTGYSIAPDRPLTASDSAVILSYTANGITRTARQAITVGRLTGIDLLTPPDRTEFVSGSHFDPAGMEVQASYSNGLTRVITAEQLTYSPPGPLLMEDRQVTVAYTEDGITETTALPITVLHRLTGVAILAPPSKTKYIEDEVFDNAGMVVKAYYSDDASETVTGYSWSPAGALRLADTDVTITYSENGVAMTAVQEIAVKPEVSEVLAENDWETIARVSAAGTALNYWLPGDEKDIVLSTGEVLTMQIYGVDHDDLADGSGKAGITFGMKQLMAETRAMSRNNTNVGGFPATPLYEWLNGALLDLLPADLREVLRPVVKQCNNGYNSTVISDVAMKVFLFSGYECFGEAVQNFPVEGRRYSAFLNGVSTNKFLANGAESRSTWWMRTAVESNRTQFRCVGASGGTSSSDPSTKTGICFGFCV